MLRNTATTETARRFEADTAGQTIAVLHDDGLYRHLRFKTPGAIRWFDLVTWPGYLSLTGNLEGYTFTRDPDMFPFFRSRRNGINPSYWAEKVVSRRDGLKVYDEQWVRHLVICHFAEAVRIGAAPRGLGRAVREDLLGDYAGVLTDEASAQVALDQFEFKGFRFDHAWDWDLRDYHWSYLWACHAIQWSIAAYDAVRQANVAA